MAVCWICIYMTEKVVWKPTPIMFIKAVIDEDNLLRDTPVSACVCTTISHPTSRLQSPATKDNPITNEINFVNITGTINIIN